MDPQVVVTIVLAIIGILFGVLAWVGKRFVDQLDKLAESVNNLAVTVATLQAEQKAIWNRIDKIDVNK